ncbi:MAG: DUF21 domain-containing protein [candidate division WOR-3 bacterium]
MIIYTLSLLICFVLIFTFSAYETAFLIVQRKSFAGLSSADKKFLNRVDNVLATILVGLNFFSVAASIVTFNIFKRLINTTGKAVGLAGISVSILIMLLEFAGKNYARRSSEVVISFFTPVIKLLSYLAVPVNKIILSIIFPLRVIKKETQKDRIELLKLLVAESLLSGEIDPQKAETILAFTRLKDTRVEEFTEPVSNFLHNTEGDIKEMIDKKDPVLLKIGEKVKKLDKKRYFVTGSLQDSLKEIPEIIGSDSVEKALRELFEREEDISLVKTKSGTRVFYLRSFFKHLLGVKL